MFFQLLLVIFLTKVYSQDDDIQFGQYPWENSGKFEGDILFANETIPTIRNAVVNETLIWPRGVVPYVIERSHYNNATIDQILEVMEEYRQKTCINFRPKNADDQHWIRIASDEPGCFSYIGMVSSLREQTVNIHNTSCLTRGTMIHELMHALGFFHQQSSLKRDDFVEILWDNINPRSRKNFAKYDANKVTDLNFEYDYSSVMHYSMTAFAKNKNSITILPLKRNALIGQRNDFSAIDILKIRARYNKECFMGKQGDK